MTLDFTSQSGRFNMNKANQNFIINSRREIDNLLAFDAIQQIDTKDYMNDLDVQVSAVSLPSSTSILSAEIFETQV